MKEVQTAKKIESVEVGEAGHKHPGSDCGCTAVGADGPEHDPNPYTLLVRFIRLRDKRHSHYECTRGTYEISTNGELRRLLNL